jgi:hypothetical protein
MDLGPKNFKTHQISLNLLTRSQIPLPLSDLFTVLFAMETKLADRVFTPLHLACSSTQGPSSSPSLSINLSKSLVELKLLIESLKEVICRESKIILQEMAERAVMVETSGWVDIGGFFVKHLKVFLVGIASFTIAGTASYFKIKEWKEEHHNVLVEYNKCLDVAVTSLKKLSLADKDPTFVKDLSSLTLTINGPDSNAVSAGEPKDLKSFTQRISFTYHCDKDLPKVENAISNIENSIQEINFDPIKNNVFISTHAEADTLIQFENSLKCKGYFADIF